MSSSGTIGSSSSSKGKKKKDKVKKDKKDKKAKKAKKDDKKQKKDDKKQKKDVKRVEQAKEWFCDRLDAVKYTRQLLEIDDTVATELEVLFESLDEGEVVRIDGLENKQVKKKLRHLLQALKLTPIGENGFKSADRKVAFAYLFTDCLRRAREKNAAESPVVVVVAPPPPKQKAMREVDPRCADAEACGEEGEVFEKKAKKAKKEKKEPKKPKLKGPQLPMPGIGAVEGSTSEEEESDHADDQGPRIVGEERAGIDLTLLPTASQREAWMKDEHSALGGMFTDTQTRQADSFQVTRSAAEVAAFEKAMKERGASLLTDTKAGKFDRSIGVKHVDSLRQKMADAEEAWGQSEKQQDQQRLGGKSVGPVAGGASSRKAFNPEEDMKVRKQMDPAAFSKFVDQASGELAGKFHRSGVASSFL